MSRIMAHMVCSYPDRERSVAVARGLLAGGAAYLEVQFPFSDPTADGPVIQEACQAALDGGFTVDEGFAVVRRIADAAGARAPIYIMAYASLVVARGVRRFLADGIAAGAAGFILPDLPLDYDEGVYAAADELGTTVMPVVVTSSREERLAMVVDRKPAAIYVALRRGITGERTEIGEENLAALDRLRSSGSKIMAGFGIEARDQVVALETHVHAVVVGSALVRAVTALRDQSPAAIEAAVAAELRALVG